VHTVCSTEPLLDLPEGAARALQQGLLRPPGELASALERCDAAIELLERWQDAFFAALDDDVDLEEEARVAAEAGLSLAELEATFTDDDEPLEDDEPIEDDREAAEFEELIELTAAAEDERDPRRVLPEELVSVLERELLLLPVRVRLEALVAAVNLVSQWTELMSDHEKLIGHLVLAHAIPVAPVRPADGAAGPDGRGGLDDEAQAIDLDDELAQHERLAARHGALHEQQGPGHPGRSAGR